MRKKMIKFKQYSEIISKISKKLKVSKDVATAVLAKAQEKGIDPLKWQKYLTMLQTFVKIVANYDPNLEIEEAEYQGRKVELNDPFRTPKGPKKFSVYVKNEKGNVVKVNFGDPNMEIKRDDPARRKSFRARHNCSDPGPKWKARYWSCYQWRSGVKVDN